EGEPLSPAAIAAILKEEGFAKLPRRRDDERPDGPRPVTADVDDVRQLRSEGEPLSPAAIAAILKEEGFAKLPRRRDDERPDGPRPVTADVADVRQLDLAPRVLHTKVGGLFLFLH